jgi:hypothetical protein
MEMQWGKESIFGEKPRIKKPVARVEFEKKELFFRCYTICGSEIRDRPHFNFRMKAYL